MLFANRCTWAHAVDAAAAVAGWKREELLDGTRRAAVDGSGTTAAL
jgi:hypothetical protein